jgi:hypothetical protein
MNIDLHSRYTPFNLSLPVRHYPYAPSGNTSFYDVKKVQHPCFPNEK